MRRFTQKRAGILLISLGISMALVLMLFQSGTLKRAQRGGDIPQMSSPALTVAYPFTNTVFPPDIASPTFLWSANIAGISIWRVTVSVSGKKIKELSVLSPQWKPDSMCWENIKQSAGFERAELCVSCVYATDSSTHLLSDTIRFSFSPDSVAAPIFFRQIDLPFKRANENLNSVEWRLGDISRYSKAQTLLTNVNMCGNCHSFSANGKVMGMDFDFMQDKGGFATTEINEETMIENRDFFSWSNLSAKGNSSSGLLSALSPDGRYVASTVNDYTISSFYDNDFLFFPVRGVLGIYDRFTGKSFELAGANDSFFVQCNPTWTPDGDTIIFARSLALCREDLSDVEKIKDFSAGKKDFKFDLWAIPFNQGLGGTPAPIEGASANGKSNYFPRVSPDGKWIVFTQAQNYMLRQLDSRLAILPITGGKARELKCNLSNMNSWHSWSPNSKWIAFSTKGFSPYTKIALTHIDSKGESSPPVFLENVSEKTKAVNLPEFVNIGSKSWNSIETKFLLPITINHIDIKTVNNGHFIGEAFLNSKMLKPIAAKLDITVANGRIVHVEKIETQNIPNESYKIVERVIARQTIDLLALGTKSEEEIVLIKAIENGLSSHKK